eukprot:1194445-Prorocentrum_minimum.AAC.1
MDTPSCPPLSCRPLLSTAPHARRNNILTTDQSDAGSVGIFSRRTNQTPEAWVYSHDGPIRHRKRGYILTTDQ